MGGNLALLMSVTGEGPRSVSVLLTHFFIDKNVSEKKTFLCSSRYLAKGVHCYG